MNTTIAVLAVVFFLIGFFASSVPALSWLVLVAWILTFIIFYQWSHAINMNIKNTKNVFSVLKDRVDDPLRGEIGFFVNRLDDFLIQSWSYWAAIIFLIISWVILVFGVLGSVGSFAIGNVAGGAVIAVWAIILFLIVLIIAGIFLAIYLSSIFRSTNKLSDLKDKIYTYLSGKKSLGFQKSIYRIPSRSVAWLFIPLVNIIYLLYIIIKLSYDINEYLNEDEKLIPEFERVFSETTPKP
ncbi:MAG: hypothetical protein WCP87_00960 [Atribacterota bacterium]